MSMRRFLPLTVVCMLGIPAMAAAQDVPSDRSPHGQVAVGIGAAPDYDGSDDLRMIPFVLGDVRWRGVTFELRGLRGRVDLAADPRLSIGPVIGARLDRNNADGPVGLLPDIGTAVEAGGFVGYRLGGDELGQGSVQLELSVVHDVSNTHNGLLATASAGYTVVRRPDSFLSVDVQTTWASADYTRTYFGVTPADALRSGLAAYRPGAGFRDVGAGLTAGYYFDRHFGVIGRIGTGYLVGDTADSPITDQGRRWQPLGGLTLSYRF
jgi:MipA family protein